MPTYEYACRECGHHLEIVQSFRDAALTECPACGGSLRKVFGSIGISFKGSGFYRTDSRSAGAKSEKPEKPEKPEKKAEGGTQPTSEGGTKTDGAAGAKGKTEAKTA